MTSASVHTGAARDTEAQPPDPLGDAPELAAAAAASHSRHGDQDTITSDASQPDAGRADSGNAAEPNAHGDGQANGSVDHGSILDSLPQEPADGGHPPVLMFDAVGSTHVPGTSFLSSLTLAGAHQPCQIVM